MAKARMLHSKISRSIQVNHMSLKAQLLFTWMVSHADDDGRLRGEAEYVKATVVPMKIWPNKQVEELLEEIKNVTLINRWQQNNEWFIEFPKWNDHQQIRDDRRKPSQLPSFIGISNNQPTTKSQPNVAQMAPQYNKSEFNPNPIEVNKSELNQKLSFADKDFKKIGDILLPKGSTPQTAVGTAALDAWKRIESDNPAALDTTYLSAAKRGLPADLFYIFASEISQDPSIRNPGAIFNTKVEDYFKDKTNET